MVSLNYTDLRFNLIVGGQCLPWLLKLKISVGNMFTVSYLHVFFIKLIPIIFILKLILKFLYTYITFHEIPCQLCCFVELLYMQNSWS